MAANIDSYVTNWFRVTDRTALDQLIERFHERSEVAGSQGENWTVSEDGDGRVRVTAYDLYEASTYLYDEETDEEIEVEAGILGLLAPGEVLNFTNVNWYRGTPSYYSSITQNEKSFCMGTLQIKEQAAAELDCDPKALD